MKWTKPDKLELPQGWLLPHYYEAFNALFRIENTLRFLVYVVLKESKKQDWLNSNVVKDDTGNGTIASVSRNRADQQSALGHIAFPISCPLLHLTGGELIKLALSDADWPIFKEYFNAKKQLIQSKLDELTAVRNALAHFRPINEQDVELVKLNAQHILTRAEQMLQSMMTPSVIVPSNTESIWYRRINSLNSPDVSIPMFESPCRCWVHIQVGLRSSLLAIIRPAPFAHYQLTKFDSASLLRAAPALVAHSICAQEHLETRPSTWVLEKATPVPEFWKYLTFVVSRKSLEDKGVDIGQALEDAIGIIAAESKMLKTNPSARGSIVQSGSVTTAPMKDPEMGRLRLEGLLSPVAATDPPEYWGTFGSELGTQHFITETCRFPWMPVDISDDIPF